MPTFIHIPPMGPLAEIVVADEDAATKAIKKVLNDGYMELLLHTINPEMAMMLDEDGRRKNLTVNARATVLQNHDLMAGNIILGDAVLIGRSGPMLQSCPMSLDEIKKALR